MKKQSVAPPKTIKDELQLLKKEYIQLANYKLKLQIWEMEDKLGFDHKVSVQVVNSVVNNFKFVNK